MNIPFREDYPPRHDVVFSIMFGEMELFSALLKSVTGHVLDAEEVISQASVTPDNVEHNYIRFDTFAKDKNNTVYSLDLQNTYSEELIRNRTVYYGCRSVAGQTVLKGNYDKLKKVVVSFIMTKKYKKDTPIETVRLCDDKGNVYSELLTLHNVYVPAVNRANDDAVDKDLKIFSAFFSVNSEEKMMEFIDLYKNDDLGEKLISSYSKAILRGDLQTIKGKEYFDMKISEQDIMEAKIEAMEEGRIEGRAEGRAEGPAEERIKMLRQAIDKFKNITGIDVIIETFNITETERQILAI